MEWTGFIMLLSKKSSYLLVIVSCFFLLLSCASDFGVDVERAELINKNNSYRINADIKYRLSPAVKEALQSGIALVWTVKVKIWEQQRFLWDIERVSFTRRIQIRYHALMNLYQITNERTGEWERFSGLQAALDSMASIRGLKVPGIKELLKERDYKVGLKIEFEREKLPLPLRPISYTNSDWFLSSHWYTWPLQK